MFKEVPGNLDFPAAEQDVLAFWAEHDIYEKSLALREGGKPFVFYEGPPTANGLPHPGHCLTRAIKDLFPRYKTMTGHHCLRKGGWDTHGLPVEVEVCKELGIHSKDEIETYGVEPFNRKCLESVFRYTKQWEELTRRLGFWVNLEEAYVTYHKSYVESVWWSLKKLFDAGLLYKGHKIVWWWAQGGTALSAGEVGQGYREVDDPSVFVRFPVVMDDKAKSLGLDEEPRASARADAQPEANAAPKISLLVWTTTPWTLPSNMFAAVHNDVEYALVVDEEDGERLMFAKALVEPIAKKLKAQKRWKIERTFKGSELVGLRYEPPFDCFAKRPAEGFVRSGGDVSLADYCAPMKDGSNTHVLWRVLAADFVTTDAGSGLVHEAPAFGEVDFDLYKAYTNDFEDAESVPLLCAVAPNGNFTDDLPAYEGRWVKGCDKDLCKDLKQHGRLVFQEQYRHDYPFCWRADQDPLIQYPRKSWFIRTTQFKDDMLANNQSINWLPDHIKAGRFGKFLASNVDWSLSRERYWGTPLPIWVCQNESCGHTEAIDSYDGLLAKPGIDGAEVWEGAKRQSPELSDHLKVHKPYIDAITYDCPKCADPNPDRKGAARDDQKRTDQSRDRQGAPGRMQRVTEVIDCWYDSGAMPFAQWGFPHTGREEFASQFPASFISEALDQTRGWFYSLTAISVMLFGEHGVARALLPAEAGRATDPSASGSTTTKSLSAARPEARGSSLDGSVSYPHPFETCIVLGLLMGEDGLKMSKSKKNYKDPSYLFEHEGADAMRWLFFSGQTPWTSIRFQESAIAEGQREFLIRLHNCYSFFVIYSNIDKWTPEHQATAADLSDLDRWIRSALAQCCVHVHRHMEAYDNFNAARALSEFVDALSNWYVRRSRDRFWRSEMDADKRAAYTTLHECLVTLTKLIAPFTPFMAESMYQNLVKTHDTAAPESVHLCDYPITESNRTDIEGRVDAALNEEISLVRQVVSCGRAARSAAKLRTRQPLAAIELFHRRSDVLLKHEDIIKAELNVKRIDHVGNAEIDKCVHYEVKPDFKILGPKHGPLAPKIKAALAKHPDVDGLVKQLEKDGSYTIDIAGQDVELTSDELLVELHAREGWSAARIGGQGILVLDAHITDELRDEGRARDLVNHIQQQRKKLDLAYDQRIDLAVVSDEEIGRVVNTFAEHIQGETLAQTLLNRAIAGAEPVTVDIEGHAVEVYVKPV